MRFVRELIVTFGIVALAVIITVVIDTVWLDKDYDAATHKSAVIADPPSCPISTPSVVKVALSVVKPPIRRANPTTTPVAKPEVENPHAKSDGDDHGKGKGDRK